MHNTLASSVLYHWCIHYAKLKHREVSCPGGIALFQLIKTVRATAYLSGQLTPEHSNYSCCHSNVIYQ